MKNMNLLKRQTLMTAMGLLFMYGVAQVSFNQVKNRVVKDRMERFDNITEDITLAISSQFHERYGDVQVFALNDVFKGNDFAKTSKVSDDYVKAYGLYDLILLVGSDGSILSSNSKDIHGNLISSELLKKINFSQEAWFQEMVQGKFSQDATGPKGTKVVSFDHFSWLEDLLAEKGVHNVFAAPVSGTNRFIVNVANKKWIENEFVNVVKDLKHLQLGNFLIQVKDGSDHVQVFYAEGKPESIEAKVNFVEPFENGNFVKSLEWKTELIIDQEDLIADLKSDIWTFILAMSVTILALTVMVYYLNRSQMNPLVKGSLSLDQAVKEGQKLSQKLSESAAALSQASTEQASAIQESVSALAEMNSMISQTSQSSTQGMQTAEQVSEKTEVGLVVMGRMVESMKEIEKVSHEFQEIVKVIQNIQEKTSVINEIVFKTQLLSFNASIEAARAGTHGRGFAVVAEEVGSLAQMSGNAAAEIEKLLVDSQRRVGSTVDGIRKRVKEGAVVSDEAVNSFQEIADSIRVVKDQVKNIAEASKQQEIGIQETQSAMQQLDATARSNQESAHEVQRLSQQMEKTSKLLASVEVDMSRLLRGVSTSTQVRPAGDSVNGSSSIMAPSSPIQAKSNSDFGSIEEVDHRDLSADDESFKPAA